MVRGLDTFATFFAGDEGRYVLIGGVATQLVLAEAGLPVRATRDLDIVLCVEALDAAFGEKLWAFIRAGGYEVRQKGAGGRRFYRFAKPADPTYPQMLEFFAREPGNVSLAAGAHLTPVPFQQQVESLMQKLDMQGYLCDAALDMTAERIQTLAGRPAHFVQADVRDGACSSSTLQEAASWGKVNTGIEQMVFAEAGSVMPLLASDAYHREHWKARTPRRWARLFDQA